VARYGINTLKRVAFRGGVQHFGNTYYVNHTLGTASTTQVEAALDYIVDREKQRFSAEVTFVRGRAWTQVGNKEDNNMIVDKALSGLGQQAAGTTMDRERAYLVRFRAGVDTRGRPVYLRKWWHFMASSFSGGMPPAAALAQTAELSQAERDALETWANGFKDFNTGTPSVNWTLVAKGGRQIDGPTQAHRFLEHRQLGDEWRGN
jgi:hypothetical protein